MSKVFLDIETDSLTPKEIHCICYRKDKEEIKTLSNTWDKADGKLEDIGTVVKDATVVIGHNISRFDLPVIQKFLGVEVPPSVVFDTLPIVSMVCPDVHERSLTLAMPAGLKKSQSLEAWGYRLKLSKGKFTDFDSGVSDEMVEYCKQDVRVTERLYQWIIEKKKPGAACINTEMELAPIINRMEEDGIYFDVEKAQELYNQLLADNFVYKSNLRDFFPTRYKSLGEVMPTRNLSKQGVVPGCPYTKIELDEYNPGSRQQFVARMKEKHNWEPKFFTQKGNPELDEDALSVIEYPEAKELLLFFTAQKRIGQLATGDNAWLKKLGEDNRVHGRYNQCGAITGRATHFAPNIAQVPSIRVPYGLECRSLFRAAPGKVFVGADMKGLEHRCFAGYMHKYDKGAMIHIVLDPNTDLYKEAGDAMGESRAVGKTMILGMLYGSGNQKLGFIVDPIQHDIDVIEKRVNKHDGKTRIVNVTKENLGKDARSRIANGLMGFEDLSKEVTKEFKEKGFITGLDGRELIPEKEYACLNGLLQGAGAILCKRWIIECDKLLQSRSLDFKFVAWVHDEIIIETADKESLLVAELVKEAAIKAGEYYKFPCPMAADTKIGNNWAEVH